MRTATFLAVMLSCILFTANGATVSASAIDSNPKENSTIIDTMLVVLEPAETDTKAKEKAKKHSVKKNESLYDIAKQHKTTWKRLFYKNTHIKNPNVIKVGEKVAVPLPSEKLAERPLPKPPAPALAQEPEAAPVTAQAAAPVQRQEAASSTQPRGSSANNLYTYGYCTWYVKNMRPDLPNNLGNADTWVSRARAQGIPTGSAPRAGAVGQSGMHVVYVERVNSDGTIFISEMNREGWNVRSTRTVPAGYFTYIY